jgi:serine/threonine-protein kinase
MLDRQFGKYELIRRLGRGGMADVYLARDAANDRQVAIKLVELRPDRESRDICEAERRGAMLQEQFCRLDSHVPRVHEYGTCDGHFYIDMEYVDGEDLAERIARGPIAPDHAATIACEICSFLDKAHAFETTVDAASIRGIIHGDIKPKNIRLNRDGQVKILDFGIAKGLSLTRKLTRNDFGSLGYLSPERLDSGEVDFHADCWSVGVLLYEMLAGVPPFDHQDAQKLEQLIRAREAPPSLPDQCPAALVRIVLKMLAPSVARRYPNAAAMLNDLQAFRAGEPTEADRSWLADINETEATRRTRPPADSEGPADDMTRRTTPAAPAGVPDEAARHAPDVGARQAVPLQESSGIPHDVGTGTQPATATATLVAPPADADATRRTTVGVAMADADATRRTTAPAPALPPVPPPPAAAGPVARLWRGHRRLRLAALAAVFILVVGVVWNEAGVWSAARELRVGLATRQGSEVNQIWDQYQTLSRRSLLGVGLSGVRGPLKERLVSQADQVIADYRQDAPTVREAQWRSAAESLTDALRLDPGDRNAAASLQYCEGHLQRITGEARLRKKLPAGENLHTAVVQFQEAARLNTRWPDPYLGLARTYIYGLDDLDKAIEALNEAERRGYRAGNRELVQLADGYRRRGARMQAQADQVRGLTQEAECLQKAADDYQRSLDLYGKAIGFGEAGSSLKQVQKQLDGVKARLDAIEKEKPEPGVGAILRKLLGGK